MKFSWCTLTVANLERSLAFYQEVLKLKLTRRFAPNPQTEIAFVAGAGETEIELLCGPPQTPPCGNGVSLGLVVADLEAEMAALNSAAIPFQGPIQPGPTIRFIFLQDPDGYTIQLAEEL